MRHLYIPDTQISPGVSVDHLQALGEYIVEKQPEKIIQAGDWADMSSLSSYDAGKKRIEGKRYALDIQASIFAMQVLFEPLLKYNKHRQKQKKKGYYPELFLTLGNHENRISRYIESAPILDEKLSIDDLSYEKFGWEVVPFLSVKELDGIYYSHFFPRNASGRITNTRNGAPNARTQVQREGRSCTSGHLQGLDFHIQQRAERRDLGLICGSFYMHEEDYLSPQGTAYWRGVVIKNEVSNGMYDPMFISMNYLLSKYWDGVHRYTPTEL